MAQESQQTVSELVAVIRADGRGELREGGHVTRMRAPDADELRGMVMERAIAVAVDSGRPVRVRTIDVDGVYPLVIGPDGRIEEDGEVTPLAPGDDTLSSESPVRGFDVPDEDSRPREPLHETVRLPRAGMMAALNQGPVPLMPPHDAAAEGGPVENGARRAGAGPGQESLEGQIERDYGDAEDQPLLFPASLGDEPAQGADDDDLDDDYHDAGLDSDAGLGTGPASGWAEPGAPEPGTGAPDWEPSYPRGRGQAAAEEEAADGPASAATGTTGDATAAAGTGRTAAPGRPDGRTPQVHAGGPTLDDFLADKPSVQRRYAEFGWRARMRKATGGLVRLPPGPRERAERSDIDSIQRNLDATRTIVVVNPKGGAHKTTATLMIAAAFGTYRGGYTLAWDNNETRGTLAWRSRPGATQNTAVDLLRDLPLIEISGGATIHDIDRYVRHQGDAKFDVLASDDDAASAAIIDDDAFSRLHRVLSRFYRVMVIDTGNNMRASNWEAALDTADQLVIVSTAREDTAASAAWLADGLRERGYGRLLAEAVTILSSPSAKEDLQLTQKLRAHFQRLTRAVVEVPYDQEFVGGGELDIPRLQPATRDAWRHAAAVIAQGL